jgi:hypothetical protein
MYAFMYVNIYVCMYVCKHNCDYIDTYMQTYIKFALYSPLIHERYIPRPHVTGCLKPRIQSNPTNTIFSLYIHSYDKDQFIHKA